MVSIKPIVFEKVIICIAVASHMGSGKSHASVELIKADRAAHPGQARRILIISARIQQAHTSMALYKEFGSKLYSDTENLNSANFVICQYESQYRFYDAQKWDLVIVDEIRSVLNQGTSTKTNKQNLKMNSEDKTHRQTHGSCS